MIRFIQRHGNVLFGIRNGPLPENLPFFAVNDRDSRLAGIVQKQARAGFLDGHGLDAIAVHLDVSHFFVGVRVDDAE